MADQFTPATRELMVFTKSAKRYFDLDSVREPPLHGWTSRLIGGETGRLGTKGLNTDRGDLGAGNFDTHPAGAPPLDWWKIDPDIPYTPQHEGEQMPATFYVGDAIGVMGKLPENSVDLILTSPPFLALRSYLPADHPDKALEGGSQSTPGEFIDWLLDVVEACARVLAPHGSLAIELGDTYSGSGGAGGDYADNGWRDGQPKFGGSATVSRESAWSIAQATWFAGVIDTEGYVGVRRQESQRSSPSFSVQVRITMMERQVCDRAAEIAGVGNVTQDKRGAYSWTAVGQQARYVLTNIWPYLLIKQRQAMAAIELQRNIEEKKRRGKYERIEQEDIDYRQMIREYVAGLNGRGENRGVYVPTWEPPTPPMLHPPAVGSLDGWPLAKSLSLIPESFRWAMVYGRNPFTGRTTDPWRLRNVIRWVRPNPPVGALGDKFRPATSELMVFCKSAKRYFDLDAVRTEWKPRDDMGTPRAYHSAVEGGYDKSERLLADTNGGAPPLDWWNIPLLEGEEETRYGPKSEAPKPRSGVGKLDSRDLERAKVGLSSGKPGRDNNPLGAPPLDWWEIPPGGYEGAHYAVFPPELCVKPVKAMCPEKVCRTCGEPSRRIVEAGPEYAELLGSSWADRDEARTKAATRERNSHSGQPAGGGLKAADYRTTGFTDCGHDDWRPGLVLDPFAGSGTTLAVATGHGRDAIGIDLDSRNFDLALERVGPFILSLGSFDD